MNDRLIVALHEAAHVATAVGHGVVVYTATIRPEPPQLGTAQILGQVCFVPHPDPQPSDCRPQSLWLRSLSHALLAGYELEALLGVRDIPPCDADDCREVVAALRAVRPRDIDGVVSDIRRLRAETQGLLRRDDVLAEVESIAALLLERETVSHSVLYREAYNNRCRARHPVDPHIRCDWDPHPFGDHWSRQLWRNGERDMWPGLPMPDRRSRVGGMTPTHKRLRALNRGLPPEPLPKTWRNVWSAFEDGNPIAGMEVECR